MTTEERLKEARADREMELGMYQEFTTIQGLICDLHSESFVNCPQCKTIFYPESASAIHCPQNT